MPPRPAPASSPGEPAAGHPVGLRERKKLETRRSILRAARDLFLSQGFEGTTVDRIAAAAGVSRQTCFNYFPEKVSIVLALGDGMQDDFEASVARLREADAATPDRLEQLFAEAAERLQRAPALSRTLLMETIVARRDATDRRGRAHRLHRGFQVLLEDGARRGDVRRDVPTRLLAEMTAGAYSEILTTWAIEPDYPLEESLQRGARFLAEALAPRRPVRARAPRKAGRR